MVSSHLNMLSVLAAAYAEVIVQPGTIKMTPFRDGRGVSLLQVSDDNILLPIDEVIARMTAGFIEETLRQNRSGASSDAFAEPAPTTVGNGATIGG